MSNYKKTTSIVYDLTADEKEIVKGSIKDRILFSSMSSSYSYEDKADKKDCLLAAASGILTGLLDIFLVGQFSLYDAQSIGHEQINKIVIKIASSLGCKKSTLEDSIRFLEKKYANPSDELTSEFGGGLQHHLRDFTHHASLVGLICSILVQFTGKGFGTDTLGKMISPELSETSLIGKTFEEKIVYGVINWAFHLVSDMAGSSENAGFGTGIPGPIISLLKEISALPMFQNKMINYKDAEISFSSWVSKVFNGTAFYHTNQNDLIRFDLRTEIGIVNFGAKQSLPVVINQCIVRAFYFLNRLYREVKNNRIESFEDLNLVDLSRILPFNNRCITRMITISSGTFTATDAVDAAIRAKVKTDNDTINFATKFLLRINFVGIANFAIALKNDARNIIEDIKNAISGEGKDYSIFEVVEMYTIDIDADMDNSSIYRHRFDELLQNVKRNKKYSDNRKLKDELEQRLLFNIGDQDFYEYKSMVSYNESWIIYTVKNIVLTIFKQNNIPYEKTEVVNNTRFFGFVVKDGNKRVGIDFRINKLSEGLKDMYSTLKSNTNVDEVRFFFALNIESESDEYIRSLNDISRNEYNDFLRFGTLKDFFDSAFGKGEYEIFKDYVDDFNEKVRRIMAYKVVTIPTDDEICSFKYKTEQMLKTFNYESMLPSNIFDKQKKIMHHNYYDCERYKALLGDSVFSDSFITSEWNYMVNRATGALDKTAIIAGYLKSVEQLLYAVIRLSINQNRLIRLKNGEDAEFNTDNEEHVDSTLGTLTYFVKNNGDILDVNNYVKKYIVNTLFTWIVKERNGHFHKDNIHDERKVDEIRRQTLLLYYLILGSFKIKYDDYAKIGIISKENKKQFSEEELYQKFEKWASPIIQFDIPKESGAVGFMITAFKGRPWEIALQALRDSTESDYRWNWNQLYSTSYMANNFSWTNELPWNEGLAMVIHWVERLIQEDDMATKKLRCVPKIIVGGVEVYKTIKIKEMENNIN